MLNEKLRHAREIRGWTQKDVADNIDLPDVRSLRRWERGEAFPTLHYRAKLCKLFEMNAEELQLIAGTQRDHEDNEDKEVVRQGQYWPEEQDKLSPSPPLSFTPTSVSRDRNRQRILERVHAFWIKGVFEQSFREMKMIPLSLKEKPDALINPWGHITRRPPQSFFTIPVEKDILQIYDEAHGELLILGEPGSGKTTLLLKIANDLLARAFEDEEHPIPVVLNLSSWSPKDTQLATWLVDELNHRYHIPHDIGQAWVSNDYILPLLDGLDEITPTLHKVCIEAINTYHQAHCLTPLVVCTRDEEYREANARLMLQQAVCIQSLTPQQIDLALNGSNDHDEATRTALHEDRDLYALVTTPLMLSILITAYRDYAAFGLQTGSLTAKRQQLIATYIERMLVHRKPGRRFTVQQTMHWLAWLARQMKQRYQTEFYLERMQLDWLADHRLQRLCFGIFNGLCAGLLVAGLIGFIDVPLEGPFSALLIIPCLAITIGVVTGIIGARLEHVFSTPLRKIVTGVGIGSLIALLGAWVNTIFVGDNVAYGTTTGLTVFITFILLSFKTVDIRPIESVSWSWLRVSKTFSSFLAVGTLIAISIGTVGGLFGWFLGGLGIATFIILLFGLFSLLVVGLLNGLSGKMIDEHTFAHPNQGIYRSLYYAFCNASAAALFNWLILTIVGTSVIRFFPYLELKPNFVLFSELAFATTAGLIAGVCRGGEASLKHTLLRLLLWRNHSIPWNYPQFLDEAAYCILIRKVGGGYIFTHQLILDHFASLDEEAVNLIVK